MPGRLLARTTCFLTALGAVGEEFDTSRGAVEQMLARGGPAPPSVPVRPFFRLCRPPFSPPIFPFASVRSPLLFASSLSVFLVASVGPFFYLHLCPPSSPSFSPLSPAHLYLSAFGAHRSLCALSAHPASVRPLFLFASVAYRFLRVLSACLSPYLSLSASPFHLCHSPFSMHSGSLPFRRFLSACLFLCLSPSGFLPAFVRPSFPLPPSVRLLFLSPVTRRSLYFAHPPFSTGFPSLPVWPFRTCYPSFSPPFPFALSAQFSSPPLHPPISLRLLSVHRFLHLLSICLSLRPCRHLLSIPLFPVPVRPPGRKEGRPLDI